MIAGKIGLVFYSLRKGFKAFIPIIILIVFTLIGALIFMTIEGPNEKYELEQLKLKRQQQLDVSFYIMV